MVINDKEVSVVAYHTDKKWVAALPSKYWLCIVVINEQVRHHAEEVVAELLSRDVAWISTVGQQCEWAHDLLDEEIAFREVESLYLPPHLVMTTWHPDFEEGLWFALFAAESEEVAFQRVAILDMSAGVEQERIRAYLSSL